MNFGMMQPVFMPWVGLFELIYKSDIFVFLDDFQFSERSWDQRNRLFIIKGLVGWYTIPVRKSLSFRPSFNHAKIDDTVPWRKKMIKRVQQNYSKASFFEEIFPLIKEWLSEEKESLASQNIAFIKLACDLMKIDAEFRLSSNYQSEEKRSKRLLQLLRFCGAKRYYCAKGSFDYMLQDGVFPVDDIDVLFQDFQHSPYIQIGSPDRFVPYLSVLDSLMNVGPDGTLEIIRNATLRWWTWEEKLQCVDTEKEIHKRRERTNGLCTGY